MGYGREFAVRTSKEQEPTIFTGTGVQIISFRGCAFRPRSRTPATLPGDGTPLRYPWFFRANATFTCPVARIAWILGSADEPTRRSVIEIKLITLEPVGKQVLMGSGNRGEIMQPTPFRGRLYAADGSCVAEVVGQYRPRPRCGGIMGHFSAPRSASRHMHGPSADSLELDIEAGPRFAVSLPEFSFSSDSEEGRAEFHSNGPPIRP